MPVAPKRRSRKKQQSRDDEKDKLKKKTSTKKATAISDEYVDDFDYKKNTEYLNNIDRALQSRSKQIIGSSSEDDEEEDEFDSSEDESSSSSSDSSYDDSDSSSVDFSDDDSSEGGYRYSSKNKKRRKFKSKNSQSTEAIITRKVQEILADATKAADVRKQLDAVLKQADLYAEFLRTQVEEQASLADNEENQLLEPPEGCALLPHQVYGVNWLVSVFSNGINAILSDEQGLGKTIEVIGFLSKIFTERIVGPHVIVVPLSTIDNWRREFARWAPGIRLLVLHGAKEEYPRLFGRIATEFRPPYSNEEKMRYPSAKELAARCGGVILTSFEVAMRYTEDLNEMPNEWKKSCVEAHRVDTLEWRAEQERNQQQLQEQRKQAQAEKEEKAFCFFPSAGQEKDEGAATAAAAASSSPTQQQQRRAPEIDSAQALTSRTWGVLVVDEAHRLKNFQCLLIQQLRTLTCESRLLLTGTPMHNRLTELWSILHFIVPELFQSVVNFRVWFGVSDELVRTTCSYTEQLERKESASTAAIAQKEDGADGKDDDDEDQQDGKQLVLLERNDDEDFDALLRGAVSSARAATAAPKKPTGKRGGRPKKRSAAADEEQQQQQPEEKKDDDNDDDDDDDANAIAAGLKKPPTPSKPLVHVSMAAHTTQQDQHIKQLGGADESVGVVAKMHRVLRPFMLRRTKNELPELNLPRKTEVLVRCPLSELQKRVYREALTSPKYRAARLPHLRSSCNHPYLVGNDAAFERYAAEIRRCKGDTDTFCGDKAQRRRYIKHLMEDSTKTNVIMNLLPGLAAEGHVTLVFSGSTQMLDTLAELLDAYAKGELQLGLGGVFTPASVPLLYRRLQGGQKIEDRNTQLNEFLDDKHNVSVFLISTRAGGVGLNLMRADTVILCDPNYNPHTDIQAIDRCHRIGQHRPVVVYRLFSLNTVEEVILECCTHKLRLEGLVIGAGKYMGIAGAPAKDDEKSAEQRQQQVAELRRREADAIRSALGRLRTMVLQDFSLDKNAANKGLEVASSPGLEAGSLVTGNGDLLTFVESTVGGAGHYVFNVDGSDPVWGLDILVAGVPRD